MLFSSEMICVEQNIARKESSGMRVNGMVVGESGDGDAGGRNQPMRELANSNLNEPQSI